MANRDWHEYLCLDIVLAINGGCWSELNIINQPSVSMGVVVQSLMRIFQLLTLRHAQSCTLFSGVISKFRDWSPKH